MATTSSRKSAAKKAPGPPGRSMAGPPGRGMAGLPPGALAARQAYKAGGGARRAPQSPQGIAANKTAAMRKRGGAPKR